MLISAFPQKCYMYERRVGTNLIRLLYKRHKRHFVKSPIYILRRSEHLTCQRIIDAQLLDQQEPKRDPARLIQVGSKTAVRLPDVIDNDFECCSVITENESLNYAL